MHSVLGCGAYTSERKVEGKIVSRELRQHAFAGG